MDPEWMFCSLFHKIFIDRGQKKKNNNILKKAITESELRNLYKISLAYFYCGALLCYLCVYGTWNAPDAVAILAAVVE